MALASARGGGSNRHPVPRQPYSASRQAPGASPLSPGSPVFPLCPVLFHTLHDSCRRKRNRARAEGQSGPEQGAPSCPFPRSTAGTGARRQHPSLPLLPSPRASRRSPPPGHSPAKQGLAARQVVHAGSLEKQPVLNLCQTTKSHSEPAVPGKRRNLQTTEPLSTCFLEGRSHTTSQPGRHLLSGAPGLR